MQLAKDADVLASSGEKVGTLDRVVLDPTTQKVTHIVAEKGILFETKKLIPIEYVIESEGEKQILLNQRKEDLDKLPAYDESAYIGLDPNDYPDEQVDAVYWYPPLPATWGTMGGPLLFPYREPRFVHAEQAEQVLPEGTIALKEGAKVVSKDDKHIGNIEEIIVEPTDKRATHIVISEGIFLKKKKLVPAHWITDASENKVFLTVWSDLVDRLPDFEREAKPQ